MTANFPWLFDLAISLGHGLAVMALIAICYGTLDRLQLGQPLLPTLQGLMFGAGAVMMMSAPVALTEGVIIDARSVVVGFASAFGGVPVAAISAAIAVAFRLALGGQGAEMGAAGIALAALIGLLWSQSHARLSEFRPSRYALLGLALSAHVATLTFIPQPGALLVALKAWALAAPCYALAGIILGGLMQRERMLIARERTLHERSQTDQLTNIANRRRFVDRVQSAIRSQAEGGECFAILLIDVDHFKAVNDAHGHIIGDEAIIHVADVLRTSVGPHDLAARYGGEEFAILLCDVSPRKAVAIADRIRKQIEATTIRAGDSAFAVTVSIGVAASHGGDHTMKSILSEADVALYAAKAAGRNRVEFHGTSIELAIAAE